LLSTSLYAACNLELLFKDKNMPFEKVLDCYFELSFDSGPNKRLSTFAASLISDSVYPQDIQSIDSNLVKTKIREIYDYELSKVSVTRRSLRNAKADLLEILETRYSALFLESSKEFIDSQKIRAMGNAKEQAAKVGGTTFVLAYLSQRQRGSSRISALSTLLTLGSAAAAFKLSYDSSLGRLYVDGFPPAPSHVLGYATQGSEQLFDRDVSGDLDAYMIGILGFALFPIFEKPIKKFLWAPLSSRAVKKPSFQKIKTRLKCTRIFSLLAKPASRFPKSSNLIGNLGSALLHPANIAAALASFKLAEVSVSGLDHHLSESALLEALENVRESRYDNDPIMLKLTLINLETQTRSYVKFLKERKLAEFFDKLSEEELSQGKMDQDFKDWTESALMLATAFEEVRTSQNMDSVSFQHTMKLTSQKSLSDIDSPSELGLWIYLELQKIDLVEESLFYSYLADRESLLMQMNLENLSEQGQGNQ